MANVSPVLNNPLTLRLVVFWLKACRSTAYTPRDIIDGHSFIVVCTLERNPVCDVDRGSPTRASGRYNYNIAMVSRFNRGTNGLERRTLGGNDGSLQMARNS